MLWHGLIQDRDIFRNLLNIYDGDVQRGSKYVPGVYSTSLQDYLFTLYLDLRGALDFKGIANWF